MFGTKRAPLSGSNSGHNTNSDSLHPKLYIECKLRQKIAIWQLFEDTERKAKAEDKIPIVAIKQKGAKGELLVIRPHDLQKIAYTGNYGIRQVNGRYCVAVGSAFTTEIGTYSDLVLENGEIIPCILADCKDDEDTDINNIITHDGSLAEFVVDTDFLSKTVKYTGDVSNATENWKSKIIEVRVYERKVEL